MRVGFIGLGVMGRPMARNLLRAGYALKVWSRRPEGAVVLLDAGAQRVESPAELAAACDVVITVVTGSEDVRALALGAQGLAEGFAAGSVHVDMSTIAPAVARDLAADYARRGIGWVDAPVSGGEVAAQSAALAIMAGGEAATLERVRPLLAAMGRSIVHVGAAGAGQVAKACNQMIMVSAIQACAEAMLLARAHGVDAGRVREALMGGSAGSRVLEVMGERMVAQDYAAGVQARLHHKDFRLLLDAAHGLGVPLPVAAQVGQRLNALMARGWGGDDTASLLRLLLAEHALGEASSQAAD